MNNRRNFYRILHVQPEAPLEIIKASYRSLMTKLKAHPDLGGDHETAVLINQAYAVLSDPQRRRKYDEMLYSRNTQGRSRPAYEAPVSSTQGRSRSSYQAAEADKADSAKVRHRCLFCGTELAPYAIKYCPNCACPLAPAQPIPNGRFREVLGRRTAPRISKVAVLTIYPSWPHVGYPARLRDLSTSGFSILTEFGARSGQIIKFDSTFLKGIARVVSVRVNGANFSVHASFLTAEFITKTGVFVAEKA
jgi:curved DNA-binding protein CbpA